MKLSAIQAPFRSSQKRKRVGRGQGSGLGKTAGRGGKGQKARSGNMHFEGFEGGQMPLQRRLPKVGFRSHVKPTRAEVRLDQLAKVEADVIDILALKAAGLVNIYAEKVKVVNSGELKKKVTLKGVYATAGAKAAIESAGGKVEE